MTLKTCTCGKLNTTKNAPFIGREMGLLFFNCLQCKSTFTIAPKARKVFKMKTAILVLLAFGLGACASGPKPTLTSSAEVECTEYMTANHKPGNTAQQQRNLFYDCMSGKGAYR